MSGAPVRLRVLWWIMVRAERIAGWCRAHWVKWHDTGGVILPQPYVAPTLRQAWFVVQRGVFKCASCSAAIPTLDVSLDSLPPSCPVCGYQGAGA